MSGATDSLVRAASASLQAHEQLCHLVTSGGVGSDVPIPGGVVDECVLLMDRLRILKSRIEGSYHPFQQWTFDEKCLSHLKHLVVSHTPAAITEQHKATLAQLVSELLGSRVKQIVYCCLLSCPFSTGARCREGDQASKNVLFLVFVATDEQFFSLATQHDKGLSDVINQEFFYACEVRRFCSELLNGNVRYLEALSAAAESLIISSPQWLKLGTLLEPRKLLGKTFADRCLGQAVGGLTKRNQAKEGKGSLAVSPDVTMDKICDSFRLLSFLDSAVSSGPLCCWGSPFPSQDQSHYVHEAMQLLRGGFKGTVEKEVLFDHVLEWKKHLCVAELPGGEEREMWTSELGQWLTDVRLKGASLSVPPSLSAPDELRLSELLGQLKLDGIDPQDVLVVCEVGSKLYNLSLPTSDSDYIVIFHHPTAAILSSVRSLKETQDSRGLKLLQEGGAYEARFFCEMLLKGAVNMVELLFAEQVFYCSEAWRTLTENKDLFLSEKVVLQYIGYVKTHMQRVKSTKHSGTPRESKIFYSIFHKLLSLENFVDGLHPAVHCTGDERDFIMRIRTGPLEGEWSPDRLYALTEQRLATARAKLRARANRMREFGDSQFLQQWLMTSVRRIPA